MFVSEVPSETASVSGCSQKVSLLYDITSGTKPFEELAYEEVQRRLSNGDFPDDATSLPCSLYICSG